MKKDYFKSLFNDSKRKITELVSKYISKTLKQTYGIRTLRSELDTVLVSLKLLRILSTCSASITFSSFAPPSSGGKNTAAGVNGYLGAAFRPI